MVYDVIIIGMGPAGISASLYTQRAGMRTLVIGTDFGSLGKTAKIENYYGFPRPVSGRELAEAGVNQAERIGAKILKEEVINVGFDRNYIVKTKYKKYHARALILATGTKRNSVKIEGIERFEGKGISYCAICDGFFYRGKDVAVIGEGDYAISEAMELVPIANSVTMLTNGKPPIENRSSEIKINEKPIQKIVGEERVKEVRFADDTNLETDGIFVAVGTASSTDFAKKLSAQIEGRYIKVNEDMKTNIPGLFAAGDCTGGLLQISKAVADGAKAGISAVNYVRSHKNK